MGINQSFVFLVCCLFPSLYSELLVWFCLSFPSLGTGNRSLSKSSVLPLQQARKPPSCPWQLFLLFFVWYAPRKKIMKTQVPHPLRYSPLRRFVRLASWRLRHEPSPLPRRAQERG